MKIAVIGAGVVGVTTAYKLAKQGHDVSVFDREPAAAMESSFANGGQLSYGFASPMGSPSLIGKIPAILMGADPAFRLPSVFTAEFLNWSIQFLNHCLPAASKRDAANLSQLAAASGQVFHEILEDVSLSFGHRRASKLVLLKSSADVEKAAKSHASNSNAIEKRVLDWNECLLIEPALNQYTGQSAGGVWVEQDEVGDAASFSSQLVEHCQRELGVKFHFNADVAKVIHNKSGVTAISLSVGEDHSCDAVVVCTGVAGKKLLKDLDISLPIYPVMGYSLTAPIGKRPPEVAITDAGYKIVFSRIGEHIRIAGFADFGIASEERRRQRIQELIKTSRTLIPEIADYASIKSTWIGARPATPSSLPIVRTAKVPGVYLNMGHGMFGWTLSAGAAQTLSELIGPASQYSQAA
jgi:D-amino-acid dehydrogenase